MVKEKSEEKTTMLPRSRFKFSWSVPIISLMLLASAPANALPNAIAVLPFKNLSPDPENAYIEAFGRGEERI